MRSNCLLPVCTGTRVSDLAEHISNHSETDFSNWGHKSEPEIQSAPHGCELLSLLLSARSLSVLLLCFNILHYFDV